MHEHEDESRSSGYWQREAHDQCSASFMEGPALYKGDQPCHVRRSRGGAQHQDHQLLGESRLDSTAESSSFLGVGGSSSEFVGGSSSEFVGGSSSEFDGWQEDQVHEEKGEGAEPQPGLEQRAEKEEEG
jgi:hypothetical protein